MFDIALRVAEICLPVFAFIVFGWFLRRIRFTTDAAQQWLTAFVYKCTLPVIIFLAVASEDFATLANPAVVVPILCVIFIIGPVLFFIARTLSVADGLQAPVSFSVFFSNTAFLGFPLAYSTFGDAGTTYAAIVNAFAMPLFVVVAVLMLTRAEPKSDVRLGQQMFAAFANPIVAAALVGVVRVLCCMSLVLPRLPSSRQVLCVRGD